MMAGSWRIAALLASPLVLAGLLAAGVADQPQRAGEAKPVTGTSTSKKTVAPVQGKSSPSQAKPTDAKPKGAKPADAKKTDGKKTDVKHDEVKQPEAKLTPAQVELRDRLRRVLAFYLANQTFNTRENTPAEVVLFCLAFGVDAQVGYDGPAGAKVNAIGALCWNIPCSGYSLLQTGNGRVMARVGYGLQDYPGQFLAVLAQSRVSADYEIRVGQQRYSVAGLVESEKLSCRAGGDLSMQLLALSHYLPADAAWNSAAGESWSLERLVQEELERQGSQADVGATNRLMGLSYAVDCRGRHNRPIEGAYARAQKYVADCQEFALRIANADGSWNPRFFAFQGTSSDAAGALRSTGHILEWLVFSLADSRLEEPQLVRSIAYAVGILENWQQSVNAAALSPRLLDALMHTIYALDLYDQRAFKPFDPKKP